MLFGEGMSEEQIAFAGNAQARLQAITLLD